MKYGALEANGWIENNMVNMVIAWRGAEDRTHRAKGEKAFININFGEIEDNGSIGDTIRQ